MNNAVLRTTMRVPRLLLQGKRFRSSEPLAAYEAPPLDQSFQPNTPGSKMPVFNPMDNATGHVNMEKHCKHPKSYILSPTSLKMCQKGCFYEL